MIQVRAFEAKNDFDHLLDLVEAGDEIVITRHGKIIATMISPVTLSNLKTGQPTVAARIRARRSGITLGGISIKDMIAEGRL